MTAPATVTVLLSVNCASCGRPLTDALSAEVGLGPDCRAQLNYRHISSLSDAHRTEANLLIHAIADGQLRGEPLRDAIFKLHTFGFVELAQRIDRRVGRQMIDMPADLETPPPNLNPPPFTPTEGQSRALDAVRKMPYGVYGVCVVVGYAGTGKTSSLRLIAHEHGEPVCIAPTGKAALRIREATGLPAKTIHRWIYEPVEDEKTGSMKFERRDFDEIEAQIPRSRLVVLDEASMVGPDVWKDIREVCEAHDLRLVCVGDGFQLPPVQPPGAAPFSVLSAEFAQQLNAPRVEMTEVLRQAQDSPIIRASMALRGGAGWSALRELQSIAHEQIGPVALAVHQQGGVTICHRNVTRFQLNAGFRQSLGITDEMPQIGEPLMVLRNTYECGVVNGETIVFPGWEVAPEAYERVYDRWKQIEENARFGGIRIEGKTSATLAIEELHGRLTAGSKAISIAAGKWARAENFFAGDRLAPHVSCNFGYAWTAHKAQGSGWPYVLVMLEPSVRLDEEEGRRWTYTSITRASVACAVYAGRL